MPHKQWPVGPLSATDRDGWPEFPVTLTAPGPSLIAMLVVSGPAGGHGVGGLGASGGGVVRRRGLGGTSGGVVQHPGQRLPAPSQGTSSRPLSVGPAHHPPIGRPRSPPCWPPGCPLPRQPVEGGQPGADGRGTPSQFGTATATRRGGGPSGPLGPRRAAGSRDSGPPSPARHVRSDCPAGRNPQLEPVEMKMSPGLLDCLVFSGPQFTHPKLSTGEHNDS